MKTDSNDAEVYFGYTLVRPEVKGGKWQVIAPNGDCIGYAPSRNQGRELVKEHKNLGLTEKTISLAGDTLRYAGDKPGEAIKTAEQPIIKSGLVIEEIKPKPKPKPEPVKISNQNPTLQKIFFVDETGGYNVGEIFRFHSEKPDVLVLYSERKPYSVGKMVYVRADQVRTFAQYEQHRAQIKQQRKDRKSKRKAA